MEDKNEENLIPPPFQEEMVGNMIPPPPNLHLSTPLPGYTGPSVHVENINILSTSPSLLANEEKNYRDIVELRKKGVSIELISRVKNVSIMELLSFMSYKSIPTVAQDNSSPQQKIIKAEKRKRRKSWKIEDFPKIKPNEDFYCADCEKGNSSYQCGCGRKCWKYCYECKRYYSNHHKCFKKNKRNRKRLLKKDDFPSENKGKFFCGDCQKTSIKRNCECGRDCWSWCEKCNRYFAKLHASKYHKEEEEEEKNNNKSSSEEEEEEEYCNDDFLVPLPQQMIMKENGLTTTTTTTTIQEGRRRRNNDNNNNNQYYNDASSIDDLAEILLCKEEEEKIAEGKKKNDEDEDEEDYIESLEPPMKKRKI